MTDMILFYVQEANNYLKMYQEIPFDIYMYEDAAMEEIEKKNKGFIANAIESLKKLYHNLINACTNLFNKLRAKLTFKSAISGTKSEKYNDVKEKIKTNPEFGKVEVEIDDAEAYDKIYDDVMQDIDKAEEQSNGDIDIDMSNMIMTKYDKAVEELKKGGKRALTTVSLTTLLDMADHNALFAKALNAGIKSNLIDLSKAEKALGSKEIERDKKRLERYARNGPFHRMRIALHRKHGQTMGSILLNRVNTLISFSNVNLSVDDDGIAFNKKKNRKLFDKRSAVKGTFKNARDVHNTLGQPTAKQYLQAGKTIMDVERGTRQFRRDVEHTVDDIKRDASTLKSAIIGTVTKKNKKKSKP